MGLVLKATGANFEEGAVSFIPPVERGLVYWGFPNDSLEKAARNYAPGGAPAAVVGSPTLSAKGAVMSGGNYVRTAVTQTPSITLIAVGHPVGDGAELGMFISNYSGARPSGLSGNSYGASIYCAADDANAGVYEVRAGVASFSGVSGAASVLNSVSLAGLDITKPAFLAMSFDATEAVVRAYNFTTGVSGQRAPITDKLDIGTPPFYVGATPSVSWTNRPKNIHFSAIYDRKLNEEELRLIYERIKSYLAPRNVSI